MIRITGGENRSRLLQTPNTNLTKPTMDRVREGVFSALGDTIKGAIILDLFAGSGSYGFESLSRGAKHVTFVDSSTEAITIIERNSKNLKCENMVIKKDDVLSFLSGNPGNFDIIFVDPPYKLEVYEEIVKTVIDKDILSKNGIIVLESEKELKIDEKMFKNVRFYKYGIARVYILRK